jgi:signal transduction histidine kinase
MVAFSRLSLARQFLLASFPILALGMLIIGYWVGTSIEGGVVSRVGGVTGLYVDSFIAPQLQTLQHTDTLSDADRLALDSLLTETPLGQRIVAFKIWSRDGRILYSRDAADIGRSFPIGPGLAAALAGEVHSKLSDLSDEENEYERSKWTSLLETYSPVHADRLGTVLAVAEFYQTTEELTREMRAAQRDSWFVVAGTMLTMYLLIFGLVRRGSHTIDAQRRDLSEKVRRLSAANAQNEQLHDRVRRAAARTTALNERFLKRISNDLHDGPGQDLGFALMHFESLADGVRNGSSHPGNVALEVDDFRAVHSALQSALGDLRSISAGLQLPEIDSLEICEVAARAVRDYERKTNARVALSLSGECPDSSLPVRITVYRVLQEALANGFRHAAGSDQSVDVSIANGQITVAVRDRGPGFQRDRVLPQGHLGLAGMRERVEILGGSFQVHSEPGEGVVIRISLPLHTPGGESD